MGFGGISIWQLLIILVVVVLIFGSGKLKSLGSDLGSSLKGFKKAVKEEENKDDQQLFQVGFLEIAIILILGLIVIGPKRLPDLIKTILKFYKKVQKQISNLKNDLEEDIGTEEIKKDSDVGKKISNDIKTGKFVTNFSI